MNIRPKLAPEHQMTVEEFLAFTGTRPEEERWELIEGVPVLNPSPVQIHQLIVLNIASYLSEQREHTGATWLPILGVGTRVPVSPNSLPQPDLYVQQGAVTDAPVTEDALVIFEVLSRSNTKADQEWRKKVYASVPNCQHYVTVSQKSSSVVSFDRDRDWRGQAAEGLAGRVELSALGISIPLAKIYRWTPIAQAGSSSS